MTDLFLQIGGSKLALSLPLACAVWVVHRRVGRCAVSYPLWLLVLITLVAPAVVPLPILPAAAGPGGGAGSGVGVLLVSCWLVGTGVLLAWSLLRAFHFQRSLRRASRVAAPEIQREAAEIGRNLGLARIPTVHTTGARISPMVWWTGGRVRVLIPRFLLAALEPGELRAILAHELAHARRRDYLVRWLEWLACSLFWWNPVAWWARRQLRIAEEWCCDALGVAALKCDPRSYARSLLRAIELMSAPKTIRAPTFASAADRGVNAITLGRRLEMIMTRDTTAPTSRRLRAAIWIAAVCVLPFGTLYCGTADEPEPAASGDEPVDAPPTPLAWSDEDFLNADAAELADQMLADIDLDEIREESGSVAEYLRTGLTEMREALRAEVDGGALGAETAEQFMGVSEELFERLVERLEARTLSEQEALNQFVYGMVRIYSVNVELEEGRVSEEEARARIDALRRELRNRDAENREYALLRAEQKLNELQAERLKVIKDFMIANEGILRAFEAQGQRDTVRDTTLLSVIPVRLPVIVRPPLPVIKWFCDEDGNCEAVVEPERPPLPVIKRS